MKSIVLVFLAFVLQISPAVETNLLPQELFVQQEYSNTCTLSSAVMMIRSCLYQGDSRCWSAVTEGDVLNSAWTSAGLSWQWNYETGENTLSVAHSAVSGTDEKTLKLILEEHPEGIVLYCGGAVHHGVFLYDYKNGSFYCADPAAGYAGEGIKLSDSLLGERIGTQDQILRSVSAYWYISSSQITPDVAEVTEQPVMVRNRP